MPVLRKPPPKLDSFEGTTTADNDPQTVMSSSFFPVPGSQNPETYDNGNPNIDDDYSSDTSTDSLEEETNNALPDEPSDDLTDSSFSETFDQYLAQGDVRNLRSTRLDTIPEDPYPQAAHGFETPIRTFSMAPISSPDVVDSFHYDPEQYGRYTRLTYPVQPFSRSPTPGVHDNSMTSEKDLSGILIHSGSVDSPTQPQQEDPEKESIDEFLQTKHFGPAPRGRMHRRRKTKRRIFLTEGNLVTDIDVPTNLVLPWKGEPEMKQTRNDSYTAVTCDPDDFEKERFYLRQNIYGRTTELFICITMYNEDEILLCRTLYGVMKNISHLCARKASQTWGPDAWKKVVVCIIADGRRVVHPRVLDVLTALGVYQDRGHMKSKVNEKEVTAHLFEYTTSFALDPELHFKYPDKGIVPTQIIFCLKEKNKKKINSHRWFFNAFAPLLQPNVCVLLDVGTRPGGKSLYHLWKTFDRSSNVGGACGEIAAYKGPGWMGLLNPLVAAQNFEYKMSNILDKPMESVFGYISVLPGAFSAYRYIALQNDKDGSGPLASSYFFFKASFHCQLRSIVRVLSYVKNAIGETDVPDSLPEFIGQRRRWLNGSFFAAVYALAHTKQILISGHSLSRKIFLMMESTYGIILTSSLDDPSFGLKGISFFNSVVQHGKQTQSVRRALLRRSVAGSLPFDNLLRPICPNERYISWGTKEAGTQETDLGAVIQDKESRVDLEIISEPSDINTAYSEVLSNLRDRKPIPPSNANSNPEQKAKDYYASIRK
ncbi:hypothetical protein Clacol_000658 [Clathrus columnatus]|uniref:Chitin synthase n=1 Tax=Clathrus columnatus TaxID=1419009 RepID=A0AAV4ZWW2_9AGAM|nr:hypothetical protein Clacol_000658 [Clathrus columnatus]